MHRRRVFKNKRENEINETKDWRYFVYNVKASCTESDSLHALKSLREAFMAVVPMLRKYEIYLKD